MSESSTSVATTKKSTKKSSPLEAEPVKPADPTPMSSGDSIKLALILLVPIALLLAWGFAN